MLTIEWQPLSPRHGFTRPEAIDLAGETEAFDRAMERSAALHDLLFARFPAQAPYAVALAYKVRFVMQMNAREAMHLLELRSGPQGHPAYRLVAQEMHRQIAEDAGHHAVAEMMSFVDHSPEPGLERLDAERRAEARRQGSGRRPEVPGHARRHRPDVWQPGVPRVVSAAAPPPLAPPHLHRTVSKDLMAADDDDLLADDPDVAVDGDADLDVVVDDEEFVEDLVDDLDEAIDEELVADVVDPDIDEAVLVEDEVEDTGPVPVRPRARADDDEEDDEEADPDDVEEDLDTILRDRITAGTDEEEEEDEDIQVDDRSESGDRVAPRAAEEHACPECFLLVRRSQFSARKTDCPGGLDGEDCPMRQQFA
jgi:hypothetical protein